jgi:hypothetical protein
MSNWVESQLVGETVESFELKESEHNDVYVIRFLSGKKLCIDVPKPTVRILT